MHVRSSSTPGISDFFTREGLLLLPQDELESTLDSMLQAQPLLGPLAKDPSARGLFNGIDLMVEGVRRWMAGAGVTPKNFLFEKFSSANETAAA